MNAENRSNVSDRAEVLVAALEPIRRFLEAYDRRAFDGVRLGLDDVFYAIDGGDDVTDGAGNAGASLRISQLRAIVAACAPPAPRLVPTEYRIETGADWPQVFIRLRDGMWYVLAGKLELSGGVFVSSDFGGDAFPSPEAALAEYARQFGGGA